MLDCFKTDSSHCLQKCVWARLPRQWRRLRLAQPQQQGPPKPCPPVCPSCLFRWCEQLPAQTFHTQPALQPCNWSAAAYRNAFCNMSVSTETQFGWGAVRCDGELHACLPTAGV